MKFLTVWQPEQIEMIKDAANLEKEAMQ